mmetsp:Transcript_12289/g.31894  ORF Transcript_12289/g.31894 Transcript_12289/m.31894 type:complete len:114 (+) Transcript_12289:62-403(+)
MGDASTEQRQNNWWSAWVAKQLHMKVEANGGRKHGTAPEQLVEQLHMKWKPTGDANGGNQQKNQASDQIKACRAKSKRAERGWGDRARTCRAALGKPGRMKMLNQMDVEKESR